VLLLKFFGIMDLYSAGVMLMVQIDAAPWRMILTATAWLLLKGILFKGDFASMIDFGIACYHILMLVLPIPFVTYVLVAYLAIKGVLSLL
jgi:hypothetical protein